MNVVIICVRQSSTRLPGKALVNIGGVSVLQNIVTRYSTCKRMDKIIVACPTGDDDILTLCRWLDIPCYQGSQDDVVTRMNEALLVYAPDADYVFRGLGDMLLFDVDLLDWRFDLLDRRGADVVWCGQQDDPFPVYGSRESPWSRAAWDRIVAESTGYEREHAGQWLYTHLHQFHVVYTEGLMNEYYHPYRLELDTCDDLMFFREVFKAFGPYASTLAVLRWLDDHPEITALNADVETKTLTAVDWKQRGAAWVCQVCGSAPLHLSVVKRNKLITECPACGEERPFMLVPPFLAKQRRP